MTFRLPSRVLLLLAASLGTGQLVGSKVSVEGWSSNLPYPAAYVGYSSIQIP